MKNLDAITPGDMRAAIEMDDLDTALRYLMALAGITDGGVASHVFSEFADEYEWWKGANPQERERKLVEWVATERAYT